MTNKLIDLIIVGFIGFILLKFSNLFINQNLQNDFYEMEQGANDLFNQVKDKFDGVEDETGEQKYLLPDNNYIEGNFDLWYLG